MVSQQERARLVATWEEEPLYVAGALIKCAACLLILCGLAYIGAVTEPLTERTAQGAPSHQARITHIKGFDPAPRVRTESARPVARTADHSADHTVTRPVMLETSCQGVC